MSNKSTFQIFLIFYFYHLGVSQSLSADYVFVGVVNMRLINGVMSTPIRFVYSNFASVDRLFCKYENSTRPFAFFEPDGNGNSDRILRPVSSDYSIINNSISTSGYFGIKIVGNIDRDDGRLILCQFSTRFTIGSSQDIQLSVIGTLHNS